MNQQILINNKFYKYLSPLLVLTGVIILIGLGSWQLHRLDKKNHFIESLERNISEPGIPIDQIQGDPIYSKARIGGKFLANKNIFLYGRRSASPEKDGYYLLSAFKSNGGSTYLVSRGWIPHSLKDNLGQFGSIEIDDNFDAIILPGEKKQFMVPENDNKNQVWFTINLDMAKEVLGITEDKFYLMQINSSTLPEGGKALSTAHLSKVRNNHLEYAITWYSLAVCLIIMFFIRKYK